MATYRNPAAMVSFCKAQGHHTPGEVYECAVGRAPSAATPQWYREVRRLATGGLSGSSRRRRRKKSRR